MKPFRRSFTVSGGAEGASMFADMGVPAPVSQLHELIYPTGIRQLDKALGIGGLPGGQVIEVAGANDSGKTTFAILIAAQLQQHLREENSGKRIVWLDLEHKFDPFYAAQLGLDPSDSQTFVFYAPATIEETENIVLTWLLPDVKAVPAMIVVDSVGQGISGEQLEAEHFAAKLQTGKNRKAGERKAVQPGRQAKAYTAFFQRLSALRGSGAKGAEPLFLMVNQVRSQIGSLFETETTPGGHAFHHNRALALWFGPVKRLGEDREAAPEGLGFSVYIKKNHRGHSKKAATRWEIDFAAPLLKPLCMSLIDEALEQEMLTVSGSWLSWPTCDGKEERIQGRAALLKKLMHDEAYRQTFEAALAQYQ